VEHRRLDWIDLHSSLFCYSGNEKENKLYNIGLRSVIGSGDFSGNIHFWNIEIQRNTVRVKKYRKLVQVFGHYKMVLTLSKLDGNRKHFKQMENYYNNFWHEIVFSASVALDDGRLQEDVSHMILYSSQKM